LDAPRYRLNIRRQDEIHRSGVRRRNGVGRRLPTSRTAGAAIRERPETAIPAETAWLLERMKEVEQMTPEARAALESSWSVHLVTFGPRSSCCFCYAQNPGNVPAASREARLRHRQRLILWFIDQHPDHFVHRGLPHRSVITKPAAVADRS
jgi:hypothetical protein